MLAASYSKAGEEGCALLPDGEVRINVVEQCARDVKVLSPWEGANYIQSLDLMKEKLRYGRNSLIWRVFRTDFEAFLSEMAGVEEIAAEIDVLARIYALVARAVNGLWERMADLGHDALGQFATRHLDCLGDVCAARALAQNAVAALEALAGGGLAPDEANFLRGKLESFRFFVLNILPQVEGRVGIIENGCLSLTRIDDAEFGGDPAISAARGREDAAGSLSFARAARTNRRGGRHVANCHQFNSLRTRGRGLPQIRLAA